MLIFPANLKAQKMQNYPSYSHHFMGETNYGISACYYFDIGEKNIVLPRLWTNKESKRSKIANYRKSLAIDITQQNGQNYIVFTLESGQPGIQSERNNPTIVVRRGGCYIVLPDEIFIEPERIETNWYDENYRLLKGGSIPNFEEYLYEVVKYFSPGNIGNNIEKIGRYIGAGRLEDFVPNIIFHNNKDYRGIFIKWESLYDNGRTIDAYFLKIRIPINITTSKGDELLSNYGFGIFYYLDYSSGSNIGITIPGVN